VDPATVSTLVAPMFTAFGVVFAWSLVVSWIGGRG
jgi:hypothetical protein